VIDRRLKSNNVKKTNFRVGKFLSSTLGILIILLLGIVTGIAAGFLFFYLSMYVQARKGTIILPNYINVDSQKAEQELREKGFKVTVVGESGKVIKMDPSPNVSVKVGREVKLFTENVRTVKFTLPDFKYCWYKSVEQVMRELNVKTSIRQTSGPGIYGTVVSTSPTAGSEITSFQSLVLFISSGRNTNQTTSQQSLMTSESSPVDGIDSVETTSTTDSIGGPVEIVPPSVELEFPTEKPIQPQQEPQSKPQPQPQPQIEFKPEPEPQPEPELQPTEIGTDSTNDEIEGGQF